MRLTSIFLLVFGLTCFAQQATSVAGSWKISVSVAGTQAEMNCTFKQEEAKLSGTCGGASGEFEAAGEVKDKEIDFRHNSAYNGETLSLYYKGTLESDGTIKGSIVVQPMQIEGTFVAAKQEKK